MSRRRCDLPRREDYRRNYATSNKRMALVALVVPLMTAGVSMAPNSQRLPADVLAQAPNGAGQGAGGEETVTGVSEKHDVSPPLRTIQHTPAERRPEREDIPLRPVPRGGQKL